MGSFTCPAYILVQGTADLKSHPNDNQLPYDMFMLSSGDGYLFKIFLSIFKYNHISDLKDTGLIYE